MTNGPGTGGLDRNHRRMMRAGREGTSSCQPILLPIPLLTTGSTPGAAPAAPEHAPRLRDGAPHAAGFGYSPSPSPPQWRARLRAHARQAADIDKDGHVLTDVHGKRRYAPVVEMPDRDVRERISAVVVSLVRQRDPEALT